MITQIKREDIEHLVPLAKKDGLVFCDKTIYYAMVVENEIRGFTGILFYKNKAVLKNHFVLPEYKGRGYFKTLFFYSLIVIKEMRIKVIEATATDMSIRTYLKVNFKIVKKFKNIPK